MGLPAFPCISQALPGKGGNSRIVPTRVCQSDPEEPDTGVQAENRLPTRVLRRAETL